MMFKYPVNYIAVTQYFTENKHRGMDLGWNSAYFGKNQPIYAPADGTVVSVRSDYATTDSSGNSYGNYVKIRHDETFSTLCAHMKYGSVTLKVGDKVKIGEQIGLMGSTGYALGEHLHYEVFKNDVKVDPILYTYVYPGQIVSSNPSARENLLYYKEPQEDVETLKKMIEELENKNKNLENQIELLNKEIEDLKKYSFEFIVPKTSFYEIKLYEKEKLYIK